MEFNLDNLASIATILASLTVIMGSIWVACSFKYKYDAETRKLYLQNFEKVWDVVSELYRTGKYSNEMHNKITEAFIEAKVYLPNEIKDTIEDIRTKLIHIECLESELEDIRPGEERSQKVREQTKLKQYVKNYNIADLYRKHLVEDYFGKFCKFFKK